MSATKVQTCGGPRIRLYQVIDDASVARQTGMNRAQVGRPSARRARSRRRRPMAANCRRWVGDATPLAPQTSYGTQKAIAELLVNDLRFVDHP